MSLIKGANMKKSRQNLFVRLILLWIKSFRWTAYYMRQSGAFKKSYDVHVSRAWILRQAHTVEKGLALPSPRAFFGKAKIEQLQEHLDRTQDDESADAARKIGYGVLASYVDWHRKTDQTNEMIERLASDVAMHNGDMGNGGKISYDLNHSDSDRFLFDNIVTSRRSVRHFTDDLVPQEMLTEAISIANYSPSVCNRQPWAAVVVQEPEKVKQILQLQSGNKGFDQTIHNIIVVLADTRAFVEEYEIFEPYVDAGIFSGTLVNALAARNIGSCCLNLCISHKKAMIILKKLRLGQQYFPVMMIAVGKIAEGATVAQSKRLRPTIFQR